MGLFCGALVMLCLFIGAHSEIKNFQRVIEDDLDVFGPWIQRLFNERGLPSPVKQDRVELPCESCLQLGSGLIADLQNGATADQLLEATMNICTTIGETSEAVCRGSLEANLVRRISGHALSVEKLRVNYLRTGDRYLGSSK